MIGIDVAGLYAQLSKLGFTGLLLFILVGFYQRWWAFGREVDAMEAERDALRADRDQWRERYLAAIHLADRSTAVATAVTTP